MPENPSDISDLLYYLGAVLLVGIIFWCFLSCAAIVDEWHREEGTAVYSTTYQEVQEWRVTREGYRP